LSREKSNVTPGQRSEAKNKTLIDGLDLVKNLLQKNQNAEKFSKTM